MIASLFSGWPRHFADRPEVRIVAVGAGVVFDQLQAAKQEGGLDNLVLLGWQDYREIALGIRDGGHPAVTDRPGCLALLRAVQGAELCQRRARRAGRHPRRTIWPTG